MTPAEHYAKAERLIAICADLPPRSDPGQLMAAAQVHATLATVDPVKMADPNDVAFYSQHGQCSCPQLPGAPFARISVDPECVVHKVAKP